MPIFAGGQVGVFPARLTTSLDLHAISSALILNRSNHSSLAPGWGGPVDDTVLGNRNFAAPISNPVILPATSDHPERLHARYYFFQTNRQLREFYAGLSDQEQHVLNAIDVWISLEPASTDNYLCLFSSRNSAEVSAGPFPLLRQQVLGADPSASTSISSSTLSFDVPDVFLWMITRVRDLPALSPTATLAKVEAVAGQDNAHRVTSMNNGVDFDRPGFLVAVAEIERLGPVRTTMRVTVPRARITIDLWYDGSFKVITSKTHYAGEADGAKMRKAAVADLAYVLLPLMKRAYVADTAWFSTRRAAEISAAAEALIRRYLAKYPGITI
jgi:hypothetical protein